MNKITQQTIASSQSMNFSDLEQGIHQWIEDLPMLNHGKALQMIYRLLINIRPHTLPWRQQYDVYSHLEHPLEILLGSLKQHYQKSLFPLPRKIQQMAEISRKIHQLMFMGLDKSIQDWVAEFYIPSSAQGFKRLKLLNQRKKSSIYPKQALMLCFYHKEKIINVCSFCGLAYPKKFWLQLHQLYATSEVYNWLQQDIMVKPIDHSMNHETAYKRALLLSMLNPQQINHHDLNLLHTHLDTWAKVVKLHHSSSESPSNNHNFFVALDQNKPPRPMRQNYQINNQHILLNTEKIYVYLKQLETDTPKDIPTSLQTLSASTLSSLHTQWWSTPSRTTKRYQQYEHVEALFSFSALHEDLSLKRGMAQRSKNRLSKSDFNLQSEEQEQFALQKSIDPWQVPSQVKDLHERQLSQANQKQKNQLKTTYQGKECQVLNSNSGGYQLSIHQKNIQNILIGDLIGIRHLDATIWNLASIRWIRAAENNKVIMGVQLHFPQALPITFQIKSKGKPSQSQPCFLTIDNQLPLLIFPRLNDLKDKFINITFKTFSVHIKLHKEHLLLSSRFNVWSFSTTYFSAGASWKNTHLEELMQALTTAPETPEVEGFQSADDTNSEFHDVFNTSF